jgi:hypothetical protein
MDRGRQATRHDYEVATDRIRATRDLAVTVDARDLNGIDPEATRRAHDG